MKFDNLNMKERVPWLNGLRVGIDHVCKFDQFLCPWWMLDKNENINKWDLIKKVRDLKIGKLGEIILNVCLY